jgi:hypothetical protein
VVRGTACLHDQGAARLPLEEGDQLAPLQLALELDRAARVDAVELEHRLGDIQADHGDAHRGQLPLQVPTTRTVAQ